MLPLNYTAHLKQPQLTKVLRRLTTQYKITKMTKHSIKNNKKGNNKWQMSKLNQRQCKKVNIKQGSKEDLVPILCFFTLFHAIHFSSPLSFLKILPILLSLQVTSLLVLTQRRTSGSTR